MKKCLLLLVIISIMITTACKEDDLLTVDETTTTEQPILLGEVAVVDGRLYFPNEATFREYFMHFSEMSENAKADELNDKFYNNGFKSLLPIINDRTEVEQIKRHLGIDLKEVTSPPTTIAFSVDSTESFEEKYERVEKNIGNTDFAALINDHAEILIGDDIYKYTNKGLLMAPKTKENELTEFIKTNNVIKSLEVEDNLDNISTPPSFNTTGDIKQVTPSVKSFVVINKYNNWESENPQEENIQFPEENTQPATIVTSFSRNSTNPLFSRNSTNDPFYEYAYKNLASCNIRRPWFANLFGDTKVCYNNFENRRRLKLKYYDVNLKLIYTYGCKFNHQWRTWYGLWRGENNPNLILGINSMTWKFNHTRFIFPNINPPKNRYYTSNGYAFQTATPYIQGGIPQFIQISNNGNYKIPMPELPFKRKLDVLVEVAIDEGYIKDEYTARKFFYEQLYNGVKSIAQSQLNKQVERAGIILNSGDYSKVQFYDFSNKCINCDSRETNFDWGFITPKVNYTFGAVTPDGKMTTGSWSYSYSFNFANPSAVNGSIFGMANVNGQWKGIKMDW